MRALLLAASLLSATACGVEPPCPPATLEPLRTTPRFVIVHSDFVTSAVALLDAEGEVITEAWIDSGTTRPGIVTSLTGDVVLPSEPRPGELVLIDRAFGVDLITRIAVPGGAVIAQHHTQLSDADHAAYRSNPHDLAWLEGGRLLVSRYDPNPTPGAPPLERGNDLLVIDADTGDPVERVDLSGLDVTAGEVRYYARPDRLARVGARHVVAGLSRLTDGDWAAAEGAVAVVDLSSRAPTAVPLPDLRNCGGVRAAPDDPAVVFVLCAGDPFEPGTTLSASERTRRAHAGLVALRLAGDGTATVERPWRAADAPDGPVPSGVPVPLGGGRVFFAASGDGREGRGDRAFVLDLATGEARQVLESAPFAIGAAAFDHATGLLVVPDAEVGARRFRWDGAGLRALSPVATEACRGLPAREAALMN